MLQRFFVACAIAMLLAPAISFGQFKQGDFTIEVGANGFAAKGGSLDTFNLSIQSSPQYFLTDQIAVGLRNQVNWTDGGSFRDGSILADLDYHFELGKCVPYIGANIGYQYGDAFEDSWVAGPEAGVKVFLNSTTFLDFQVAYEWNLNNGIDQGGYFYGLSIGVRL